MRAEDEWACMYIHVHGWHTQSHTRTYNLHVDGQNVHFCSNEPKQERLDKLPQDEEGPVDNVLCAPSPLPADAGHKGHSEDGERSCPNKPRIVKEDHSLCPKEGK